MAVRVGINGFGRIGRNIMRAALGDDNIDFVAVNDLTSAATLAHLLKYDSVLGNLHASVKATADGIAVNDDTFKVLSLRDPADLPWKDLGVDVVFEGTGRFTRRDDAARHLKAGAKKVIITAPAKGPDVTIVMGVNDETYNPATHHIISNASCTTNCLAPLAKVVHETFGIRKGWMTTIHSYTNDQNLLDLPHSDLRRARAAALSMIPTTTGAAAAVGEVLPELKGRLDGFAMRVPTPNVSVVDLAAILDRKTTAEEVNAVLRKAADGPMKGVLAISDEPLVSIDFRGNAHSSILDSEYTKVMDGDFVKLLSWYDNEWGYSNRCVDLLRMLVAKGLSRRVMAKLSIRDLQLRGRRVFIRVDFNVPLKGGVIGDDTRILASVPTIQYAVGEGAQVIVASHLGRPKGGACLEYSLRPVADRLAELLGQPVVFAADCIGDAATRAIDEARALGAVALLENLRFYPQEERNDPAFSAQLAALADEYVDDAFGAAHRAHASVEGITHAFARPAAGLLMEQELRYLGHALESPERPFVVILGGAKVSDKLEVIENMLGKVDRLIIGGAMAYTFLKSRGVATGKSLVEDDKLDAARAITADAAVKGVQLVVPVDHVVTDRIAADATHTVLAIDDAAIGDRMGVDIGPATIATFKRLLRDAATVVWNGPMGVFEIPAFAEGTNAVARAVAAVHGTTIVGGGDSISALKKSGVADRVTHISTGGGASLEFLGGRTLPGVAALKDK